MQNKLFYVQIQGLNEMDRSDYNIHIVQHIFTLTFVLTDIYIFDLHVVILQMLSTKATYKWGTRQAKHLRQGEKH